MKTAVYARFFIWENFQRQNDAVESVAESVAGGAKGVMESVAEDAVELGAKRDFIQKF